MTEWSVFCCWPFILFCKVLNLILRSFLFRSFPFRSSFFSSYLSSYLTTALMVAANTGQSSTEIVELLLNDGANVEATTPSGKTALMMAVSFS